MAWYSSKRATTVVPEEGSWEACIYHQTKVVRWSHEDRQVILNSGGFHSATTKTRMNEVSREYGLGFSVYQENFDWYVRLPDGSTVDFEDGLSFRF